MLFLLEPILAFCEGSTRPQLELTFAENIPWNDVSLILHTKYDFPDANVLNGFTSLSNLKENKKLHLLEIRKLSVKESQHETPLVVKSNTKLVSILKTINWYWINSNVKFQFLTMTNIWRV